MSNIEKIRQEIERRKKSLRAGICNDKAFTKKQKEEMLVASEELTRLSRFIDSLPEEKPSEDLEEEAQSWAGSSAVDAFEAGVEWQKKQDATRRK